MNLKIGVIGLGYVGLPLALAFSKKFKGTVGFDIDQRRVTELKAGRDANEEESNNEFDSADILFTANQDELKGCNFFVVTVPTPVDVNHNPDLSPLKGACDLLGPVLSKGSIVVFESTVYPGVTEEICGPWLEASSGLKLGTEFTLGYSPERINPGDKQHTVTKIVKVVSGQDQKTSDIVCEAYGAIITAGVHRASSIKVAEAAKVIENTQRDLNIALMNELAIIFDRMNISTKEVLEAASTKWNFVKFFPGLVGGHCIGVDPYYLTTKAEQLGYHPEVILAGRRINDGMGFWIGQKIVKLLVHQGKQVKGAKIGVLGLTFKENVADLRNSRVPDIVAELRQFGVDVLVHDPLAEAERAVEEYGIALVNLEKFKELDGVVLAVSHQYYTELGSESISKMVLKDGVVVDIKSALCRDKIGNGQVYWSL